MQAYREVEQKVVSETIFSQFMYKMLPSSNHLFVFKKQLCCQLALSGEPSSVRSGSRPKWNVRSQPAKGCTSQSSAEA